MPRSCACRRPRRRSRSGSRWARSTSCGPPPRSAAPAGHRRRPVAGRRIGARARLLDPAPRDDRVGFLLARRAAAPDEPLPAWLTTLPADRMTRRDVPPLSVDETAAMLREHLGLNLSRAVLTRLHAISGGTPFYALELGRDLQRRGGRRRRSRSRSRAASTGSWAPASRRWILRPTTWRCMPRRSPSRPSASSKPRSARSASLPGLEGAVAAGVLETADDGIRFAHPLLAAATYNRATPSRRREVHERLAGFATGPEERARHLSRTAVGPDESIAAALEDGAAAAAGRGAPEVAASLAEEAVRLTPADDSRRPASPAHRCRRVPVRCRRRGACRRDPRARRHRAVAGSALGDVLARRAIFALMFADLDAADVLFREAMPMAADDPRLRIAIHSGLAGIGYLSWRGWRRARLDMFLALRLAQELGDRSLELQVLGHTATWLARSAGRGGTSWSAPTPSGFRSTTCRSSSTPTCSSARILSYHGDAAEGRRGVERLIEHARASGDWTSISRLLAVLAEIEVDAGDLDEAERIASGAYAASCRPARARSTRTSWPPASISLSCAVTSMRHAPWGRRSSRSPRRRPIRGSGRPSRCRLPCWITRSVRPARCLRAAGQGHGRTRSRPSGSASLGDDRGDQPRTAWSASGGSRRRGGSWIPWSDGHDTEAGLRRSRRWRVPGPWCWPRKATTRRRPARRGGGPDRCRHAGSVPDGACLVHARRSPPAVASEGRVAGGVRVRAGAVHPARARVWIERTTAELGRVAMRRPAGSRSRRPSGASPSWPGPGRPTGRSPTRCSSASTRSRRT